MHCTDTYQKLNALPLGEMTIGEAVERVHAFFEKEEGELFAIVALIEHLQSVGIAVQAQNGEECLVPTVFIQNLERLTAQYPCLDKHPKLTSATLLSRCPRIASS